MATKSKPKVEAVSFNEYVMVRVNRPERGVPASELPLDDPRRTRYYVQATSEDDANDKMHDWFPAEGEKFAIVETVQNIPAMKFAA